MSETKTKDGGSAFPVPDWNGHEGSRVGMSLRDWFAGQALAAFNLKDGGKFSQNDHDRGTDTAHARWAAEQAYRIADAMLEARKP